MSHQIDPSGFFALPHLGVMTVQGPDAVKFLQGQSTQDFSTLHNEEFRHGAFCTPKGRVYMNFIALFGETNDVIYLVCHQSVMEHALTTLKKYAVFYKVTLTHNTETMVTGLFKTSQAHTLNRIDDAIYCSWPGQRTMALLPKTMLIHEDSQAATEWEIGDIQQGLPWLTREMIDICIPQNINLQAIGGISFKKGCYTGQEIVARTQYKGQVKSWCLPAVLPDHPVASGTLVVNQDGQKLGQIVNSCNTHVLVLINIDKKSEAQTKENIPQVMTFQKLPYTV
ncbi:YgfZ/GcvT domain-containing protein [Gynuella sunshinyii]|uniref:Putative aminomethyltransferase-like GcvT n=1 Tax=Gynuella sunshinyii YC6258 TaxID=1445510 RepID=A0A0C5VMF1_9GAMM|nr:folate-binding protein YgfZ [Gynuella sunshinyii]AJQ94528.1 putative aminomethyltransferase-like GcvT [Gynuella sunshinyii YC6258]